MQHDPRQPVIILVRPQMGENIGAAARAMLNFGLTEMRLVDPRDGWPNPRAIAMASGAAGQVLDHARIHPTLAEAMEGIDYAFATTARGRELSKPVFTPAAAMDKARRHDGRSAIVFGPERAGLENDDVARANAIVTVPVNPAFPSLNLAQAVLLMGYEWGRDTLPPEPAPHRRKADAEWLADRVEIERLGDHYEEKLAQAGFFFPETKAAAMRLNLRNMWSRLVLTRGDVRILHGVLRQLTRR
ncbi:MAG: RNA methyltransferase [Paracoccus sp. (in: a-proteobacteria)]|uniref:RNA methyltransferase n=1 Tax=unclassified Paracoccus (in: a-proteobacteria) TaxID=2688777 RepID=UPI000C62E0AD|nr:MULTISPECIES: RNA methyltransferase [unclassified Paracoccus (in: a-proteobacteria)]MAN56398.1 RNA methyltransferase [Paracoccus sp. (in: a-proteobacteria)]MCS5600876.1 RNA methyltransferase [Paracoccus sp. (in: a-proteobacteria)]MDB2551477.1 RNA methyltransferase [Paracoccus sp. (in: a-proteobacteria)]